MHKGKGPYIEVAFENARVKDHEKFFIYDALRTGRVKSRKEIQSQFDMRPGTITNAVRELIEDRLIIENDSSPRKPGRPEISLSVNFNRFVAVSSYVDDTYLYCALVNLANELVTENRIALKRSVGNDEFEDLFIKLIKKVMKSVPDGAGVAGVSLSVNGRMDKEKKCWIATGRHPGIRNFDLGGIEKAIGLPVCIKRTLDSILETEMLLEKSLCSANVLLVHWGIGISAAFSHQGKILSQHRGRFGDLGHINNRSNSSIKCTCGRYDCIDTKTAIWALLPVFRKIDPRINADEASIEELCHTRNILRIDEMKTAINEFSMALQIAYRTFSPDLIMVFGPFFADKNVIIKVRKLFARFTGVSEEIPIKIVSRRYLNDKVKYSNCYSNCYFSNCYDFFSSALTDRLFARY
jgi:transcriptional regulator of PTS gene